MIFFLILSAICLVPGGANAKFSKFFKPIHQFPIPANADVGDPLILTPYLTENKIEEARTLSEVHFDEFQEIVSYSGYFTVNESFNSNLFFWFFPSANSYKEDPVLLWLQGGPGSSSLYGLFSENGPFVYNKSLSLRQYSWHKNHSILYIDNPVGTGFSFTTDRYTTDETEVGNDLYTGLLQFFKLFPELQTNDFFVTGESYAGKYIPAIGHTIQQRNPAADLKINLKGLLIGNGYTDPINQQDYGDYVYQLGLVDANQRDKLNEMRDEAVDQIRKGNYTKGEELSDSMVDYISQVAGLVDIYNHQETTYNDTAPYESFVQSPEVRKKIHVGNTTCGDKNVYTFLFAESAQSVAPWVIELLDEYPILFFNGQLDIICAYPMMVNYLQKLNFSAADEYKSADRNIWKVGDEVAGYVKKAGNLTELLVRGAGHMVPLDQPKFAFDMVFRFVRNISLYDN